MKNLKHILDELLLNKCNAERTNITVDINKTFEPSLKTENITVYPLLDYNHYRINLCVGENLLIGGECYMLTRNCFLTLTYPDDYNPYQMIRLEGLASYHFESDSILVNGKHHRFMLFDDVKEMDRYIQTEIYDYDYDVSYLGYGLYVIILIVC